MSDAQTVRVLYGDGRVVVLPVGRRWEGLYWWFTGWTHVSFGVHVDLSQPNVEVHLPFGFVRCGWRCIEPAAAEGSDRE